MLFGEFLIEKNLVTKENLLKALVAQVKDSPSMCEIIYNNKFLDDNTLFSILTLQSKMKFGFFESCKEMGINVEILYNQIQNSLGMERQPIGQYLINMGFMDNDKLVAALDDYMSNLEPTLAQSAPVPIAEKQESKTETTPDYMIVQEMLSDEKKNVFDYICSNIDAEMAKDAIGQGVLQEASMFLQSLRGACQLINDPSLERLCCELDSILKIFKNGFADEHLNSLKTLLHKGVEVFWNLKNPDAKINLPLEVENFVKETKLVLDVQK